MKRHQALKQINPHLNPRHYALLENWYNAQITTNPEERQQKTSAIQSTKSTWSIVSKLLTENTRVATIDNGELRNLQVNATMHINIARDLSKIFRDQIKSSETDCLEKLEFAQKLILIHHQSIRENYYGETLLNNLKIIYYQDLKLAIQTVMDILTNNMETDCLCRTLYKLDHAQVLNLGKNLNQFYDLYIKFLRENITTATLPVRDDLLLTLSDFHSLVFFFNDFELFNKMQSDLTAIELEGLVSENYLLMTSKKHQAAIENKLMIENHIIFKDFKSALLRFLDLLTSIEKLPTKKTNAAEDQTQRLIKLKKEIKNIENIETNTNNILEILHTLSSKRITDCELFHLSNLIKTIGNLIENSESNCRTMKESSIILIDIYGHFYQQVSTLKIMKDRRAQQAAHKRAKTQSKLKALSIGNTPSIKPESTESKETESPEPQSKPKIKQSQKPSTKKKKRTRSKKKKIEIIPNIETTEPFENPAECGNLNIIIESEDKIQHTDNADILHEQELSISSEHIAIVNIDPYAQDESFIYPAAEIHIPPAIAAVMSLVTERGSRAYIVGGYPRDVLSNSTQVSNDIDLIVELTQEEIMSCFETYYPQPGPFEGLYIIEVDNVKTDIISVPKGFSLKENAENRDFPFNAIFLDQRGRCYTPLQKTRNFLDNIATPELELISDNPYQLFKDNPICMLRVIDFATRMKQFIPDMLQNAIRECGVHLRDLPFKAFKSHFIKLFYKQNALNNFFNIMRTRLLHHIFNGLDINYETDCSRKSFVRKYIVAQFKNWDQATNIKPLSTLFSILFFPSFVRKVGRPLADGSRDAVVTNTIINEHTHFLHELTKDFVNYPLETIVKESLRQHLAYYDQFVQYSIQRENAMNSHQRPRVNKDPQLGDYINDAGKSLLK